MPSTFVYAQRADDARPWRSALTFTFYIAALAFLLVIGIPALAIALLCGLFVWTYTGPQYDIVIINDHAIGGAFDRVVALVLTTFSGAVGIFSVLRFQRQMSGQRTHAAALTRKDRTTTATGAQILPKVTVERWLTRRLVAGTWKGQLPPDYEVR